MMWKPKHRRSQQESLFVSPEMEARIVDQLARRVEGGRHLWGIAWRVFLYLFALYGVLTAIGVWTLKEQFDYWKSENDATIAAQLRDWEKLNSTRVTERLHEWKLEIDDRVAREFETDRITSTIEAVAKNEAAELIRSNVEPAVGKFTDNLNSVRSDFVGITEGAKQETRRRMQEFSRELMLSRDELKAEYRRVADELATLSQRNNLSSLADDAIATGSRDSFDAISRIHRKALRQEDQQLSIAALSEIIRVKTAYIGTSRISSHRLFIEGLEDMYDASTNRMIEVLLSHRHWRVRAKIAEYLGRRKEPGAIEALFGCAAGDENLNAVAACVRALKRLTGEKPGDVFGYEYLLEWWQGHGAAYSYDLQYDRTN